MLSEVEEKESPLTTQTEERVSEKSPNVIEGTATPKGTTPDRKNLMMKMNSAQGAATVRATTTKRVDFKAANEDNSEMIF